MTVLKNTKPDTLSWIIRIGSFIMSIAIMVSSWFLNQAWNRISENERAIRNIELNAATVSGTRFTSTDWTIQKNLIDSERLALDRRIIRLEESLPVIKDTLLEIKQELKNEE